MKIAVIGTSNSIRPNGYLPLYQAMEYPNKVDNLSIGGANCQLIPFMIEKFDIFANYDFLITDCAVNDGDYLIPELRSADWLYNELYTIFSIIKESPIKHLHLIFPYNSENITHKKIHVQVCEELKVPYIDIGSLQYSLPQKAKSDFFLDQHHVSDFYAKQLAYLIFKKRQKISTENVPKDLSKIHKSKKYINLSLTKHNNGNFPVIMRASSLFSEQFVRLEKDNELVFDNLPELNLESILFWSDQNTGYYSLSTDGTVQNFCLSNLYANYLLLRPIPNNTFKIKNFLKIKHGIHPECPTIQNEFNFPVLSSQTSVCINALQCSQKIGTSLKWQEKKSIAKSQTSDADEYKKIYDSIIKINEIAQHGLSIKKEFLLIAAACFPDNSAVRKSFLKIVRKNLPFYCLYYVKIYLIPRKKYTMAAKILENVTKTESSCIFSELLAQCYIELKQYKKAKELISRTMTPDSMTVFLKLLCTISVKENNSKQFECYANKILNLNFSSSYNLFVAKGYLELKEYAKALERFNAIISDIRNLDNNNLKPDLNQLYDNLKKYLTKT